MEKNGTRLQLSRFDSYGSNGGWKDEAERQEAEMTLTKVESAFSTIISCLGDPNPERDGLARTPHRAAKALFYFTKGYEESIQSQLWLLVQ